MDSDGRFQQGTIRIEGGKIADLIESTRHDNDEPAIDAGGAIILPGAIDPHVHFREPGQLYKEGILNGSKAALKGGVTTVLDMPNNKPPCSTSLRLQQKRERFRRKSLVNWGVMLHASRKRLEEVREGIASTKIYMAKSSALPAITSVDDLTRLFAHYPRVSIHAEDETRFSEPTAANDLHHVRRPKEAVASALDKIQTAYTALPAECRPRVIICHMNTGEEVDWLSEMKQAGLDIWGETCPHYLYFSEEDYIRKGTAFQVNPPLRSERDQMRLRHGLSEGIIDFIGSDHAPHTGAEKSGTKPPSGIAGIEWMLQQMLHLVDEGLIDWKRFHELICTRAAAAYGIANRDGIKTGNYADLILVKRQELSTQTDVQTRVQKNLYERFSFRWQVVSTIVNGSIVFERQNYNLSQKGFEVSNPWI